MRGSRRAWIPVLLSSLAPVVAGAADSCKLSPRQQADSVKAFRSLYPIFQDPRCLNCHGAVNPFSPAGGHPGGVIDIREEARDFLKRADLQSALVSIDDVGRARELQGIREIAEGSGAITSNDVIRLKAQKPMQEACAQCHVGEWHMPMSHNFFVGRDWKAMCVHIKTSSFTSDPGSFLAHMQDDSLIRIGFKGLRGLLTPPDPLPPAMPFSSMEKHANDWVAAMDGKFYPPETCGCEYEGLVVEMRHRLFFNPGTHGKTYGDGEFSGEVVFNALLEDMDTGWFGQDVRVRRPMSLKFTQSAVWKCEGTGWRDEIWSIRVRFEGEPARLEVQFGYVNQAEEGETVCKAKGMKADQPWDPAPFGPLDRVVLPLETGASIAVDGKDDLTAETLKVRLIDDTTSHGAPAAP